MTLVAKRGWAAIGAVAGVCLLARVTGRVVVEGSSMEPALAPGDRLLCFPPLGVRPGDIVALPDPRRSQRLLVKRVTSVDRWHGRLSVEGDNPDGSTDSRHFGPVDRRMVVGRAVYRYAPVARVGPIGRGR